MRRDHALSRPMQRRLRSGTALPAWAAVVGVVLTLLLAVGCSDSSPQRPKPQQTVKLLPDTPPPPPPKPPERPPPQKQDQPAPAPKPADTPPDIQALKSDEAPGQGSGSPLQAGAVTQDYQGGRIGAASQPGGGAPALSPFAAQAYAQSLTRSLNEHLQRQADLKQREYRLTVHLWVQGDGRLQRAELLGSSGDARTDAVLREALDQFSAAAPPPGRLPQPLRVQVSNRFLG